MPSKKEKDNLEIFNLISDMRVKPVNIGGDQGITREELIAERLKKRFSPERVRQMADTITSDEFTYLLDLLRIQGALEIANGETKKNYLSFPRELVTMGLVITKIFKNAKRKKT